MMTWWKRLKQWASWLKATNCWERKRKRWSKNWSKPKLRYPCRNICSACYILHKCLSANQMFWPIFYCFQVHRMESDILPLQQANSELSEKSGMLQAEKKIMEDEIKRWKARTQVGEDESSRDRTLLFCQTYLYLFSLHHHNFSFHFSIWWASKKIPIQRSTNDCTLRGKCMSNAFSCSVRRTAS